MYNTTNRKITLLDTSINEGLVGWWMNLPFYGEGSTFYDLVGYNNCTKTGNMTIGNNGPYRKGGRSSFYTGTTGYLTTGTNKYKIPTGAEARTLSAWFYPTVIDTNTRAIMKIGSNGGGGQEFILQWYNDSGNSSIFTDAVNGNNNLAITGLITLNTWHHIVFSMTGAGGYSVILDGTQRLSGTFATAINTNTQNVVIGFRNDVLNGYIDDVRIWRRALTSQEGVDVYKDSMTGYQQTLFKESPFQIDFSIPIFTSPAFGLMCGGGF